MLTLKGWLEIDKNGKTERSQPCRSWVRNAVNWIANMICGWGRTEKTAGGIAWSVRDLVKRDGTSFTPANQLKRDLAVLYYRDSFFGGIGVGDGGAEWSYDDYELSHLLFEMENYTIRISRTNGSTYTVYQGIKHIENELTLTETGLYGLIDFENVLILVSRDLLTPPLEVLPGDTIAVRYKLEVI